MSSASLSPPLMWSPLEDERLRLDFAETLNRACGAASLHSLGVACPRPSLGLGFGPSGGGGGSALELHLHLPPSPIVQTASAAARRVRPTTTGNGAPPKHGMVFHDTISHRLATASAALGGRRDHGRRRQSSSSSHSSSIKLSPLRRSGSSSSSSSSPGQRRRIGRRRSRPNADSIPADHKSNKTWFGETNLPYFHQTPQFITTANRATTAPGGRARRKLIDGRRQDAHRRKTRAARRDAANARLARAALRDPALATLPSTATILSDGSRPSTTLSIASSSSPSFPAPMSVLLDTQLIGSTNDTPLIRVALPRQMSCDPDVPCPPPFPLVLLHPEGQPRAFVSLSCWDVQQGPGALLPLKSWSSAALTSLDLSRTQVDSAALEAVLPHLLALEILSLDDCAGLDAGTLPTLATASETIKTLSMRGCPRALAMPDLRPLIQYLAVRGPALRGLDVSKTGFTDGALQVLAEAAPGLTSLHLSKGGRCFSNRGVRAVLLGCPRLAELDLSKGHFVTGRCALLDERSFGREEFTHEEEEPPRKPYVNRTRALAFYGTTSGSSAEEEEADAIVRGVTQAPTAITTKLNMGPAPADPYDEGPAPLKLTLYELCLSKCAQITSRSVQIFALACPTLRRIDVRHCPAVGDDACRVLSEFCPLLQEVRLAECNRITSTGVAWLLRPGKLDELRRLDLGGLFRLRDPFLLSLTRSDVLFRLSALELSRACITNEGLIALSRRLSSNLDNGNLSYEYVFEEARQLKSERRLSAAMGGGGDGNGGRGGKGLRVPIREIDLKGCCEISSLGVSSLLKTGLRVIHLQFLDVRGCVSSLQREASQVVALVAHTLTTLKIGFPVSDVSGPAKPVKPWNRPAAKQGPSDRTIMEIVATCRKLETLVVQGCQQLRGARYDWEYEGELDLRRAAAFARRPAMPYPSLPTTPKPPAPPHPCLTALDVSGCAALNVQGICRIVARCPYVRDLRCAHIDLRNPADGTGTAFKNTFCAGLRSTDTIVDMASLRLHVRPRRINEERLRREAAARAAASRRAWRSEKKSLAPVVGFVVDPKYEARAKWFATHNVRWLAARRIQFGWRAWWQWVTWQRGAGMLQRQFRGFRVRVRFARIRALARDRQAKRDAAVLLGRVGQGYVARREAARRRKQMAIMNMLWNKSNRGNKDRRFKRWRRNCQVQRALKIFHIRVWERRRLELMDRFFSTWLDGIEQQVWACVKIQNLLRIGLALREMARCRAQRRWDRRFDALQRIQAWWRGSSARLRMLVSRLESMPGNLMWLACSLFEGGIGWGTFSIGISAVAMGRAGQGEYDWKGRRKDPNKVEKKMVLEMRMPDLPRPEEAVAATEGATVGAADLKTSLKESPLLLGIHPKDRATVEQAMDLEQRGMSCWYEALVVWKNTTAQLLRRGDLTPDFELHAIERMMAMERTRGNVFGAAELHKRAIRICVNMLRALDFKPRRPEICDRMALYQRRNMLLREYIRYDRSNPLGTLRRALLDEDRRRRVCWWAVRQVRRWLGRFYTERLAAAVDAEAQARAAWEKTSAGSREADALWAERDLAYRTARATLVGEGQLGIGEFMLSSVAHGHGLGVAATVGALASLATPALSTPIVNESGGGGANSTVSVADGVDSQRKRAARAKHAQLIVGVDRSSPIPAVSATTLARNRAFRTMEAERIFRDKLFKRKNELACSLEQKTVEWEATQAALGVVLEGVRRCTARSVFAVTLRAPLRSHKVVAGFLVKQERLLDEPTNRWAAAGLGDGLGCSKADDWALEVLKRDM